MGSETDAPRYEGDAPKYGGKVSERAISKMGIKDMPKKEQALSERFRLAAKEWVQSEKTASFMEEMKTSTMSKLKTELMRQQGEMSEAKAERLVKSSPAWEEYIQAMINLRAEANKWKMELETLRIENSEMIDRGAAQRHEARLTR